MSAPATLVIQSHRKPLPHPWLHGCLDSVLRWAQARGFDYRFVDDELFAPLAADLLERLAVQRVIATDLARLYWLQQGLDRGYERVVWCDADFLVFRPDEFELPAADCAVGCETWIQRDARGRPRVYPKVHNAFLMFRRDNHLLDFYRVTAERLVHLNRGSMPPQYIGPKLLTALHNIARLPVLQSAGMLSPAVLQDLADGGGDALDLFRRRAPAPVYAANLCASLCAAEHGDDAVVSRAIEQLLESGI
ncbi:MAG: hypothetical protein QNJ85_17785 [Gammaproteobacteria bacterium]|nr:hypothetical protein [Gammaproteobacteria bacterium]